MEPDDDWAVADRRYFSAGRVWELKLPALPTTSHELLTAIE